MKSKKGTQVKIIYPSTLIGPPAEVKGNAYP
jgi:hypothetical protein